MNATCQPASSSVPSALATPTVPSRAARSDRVRSSIHPPDSADERTPAPCGRTDAEWVRASRPMTTTYAATMPHCASTVPNADPAMPQPRP